MKRLFTLFVLLLVMAGVTNAQTTLVANPDLVANGDPTTLQMGIARDGELVEDFETGDFSKFPWNLASDYPWEITSEHPYNGSFCMRSTNFNIGSSTSSIEVTVEVPDDGVISFLGYISSESSWDKGSFYIDGQEKGVYSGGSNQWREKVYAISAGTHHFKWAYTKDGSVDSNEDRFYVDHITFYRQPDPAQTGWHTYCESEFGNAVGSNIGISRWAYEYPVPVLASYAGFDMTGVSLFSDTQYDAVGGDYTCTIYRGGDEPMAGDTVLSFTVEVPQSLNAWVDWDLPEPIRVTGTEPLWVMWTANTHLSNWPAGCTNEVSEFGSWWNADYEGGNSWELSTYGTWTMRQYFKKVCTITAISNMAEAGTVTGGGEFYENETCTLLATANPGYTFVGWTENGITVSTDASYSFITTDSRNLVAVFDVQHTYTLTVSCNPTQGYVTGNGSYVEGSQVVVEAVPYEGFAFGRWNDNVTENPRTVTMTGNLTLVAFFSGTGVDEDGEVIMQVYPNPAKEQIRIEGLETNSEVELFNELGALVRTVNTDQDVDISDLPAGVYVIRCGERMVRFVKE